MEYIEIVKILAGVLAGSGITWVVGWRMKRRQLTNQVMMEEYHQVEDMVENFTARLTTLTVRIGELNEKNMDIESRMHQLTYENNRLAKELEMCQESVKKLKK